MEENTPASELAEAPVKPNDDRVEHESDAPAELENDPLPDDAVARLGTQRFRAGRYVHGMVLSPDGNTLAAVSYGFNHIIHLFDAATGREQRRFWAEADKGIALTPNCRFVACAGGREYVQLWDTATGKLARRFEAPQSKVCCIALSADGRTLASGDEGMEGPTLLYAWDVATGERLGRFEALHNYSVSVALSPDGKLLASWGCHLSHLPRGNMLPEGEGSRTIQLWHVPTGEELPRIQVDPGQEVDRVAFSPDGQAVAAVSKPNQKNHESPNKTIHIWPLPSGKKRLRFAVPSRLDFPVFAFSPDGKMLAAGVEEKALHLWEAVTGKALGPFPKPSYNLSSLAFLPQGEILACGTEDASAIRLWDLRTGKLVSPGRGGHASPVGNLVFSSQANVLISADGKGTVRQWDTAARKELRRLLRGHGSFWSHYVLAPNGGYLAHVGKYGFQLWEVAAGKKLHDSNDLWLRPPKDDAARDKRGYFANSGVSDVEFSPDGRLMASGNGKSIFLCETQSGRDLPSLTTTAGNFRGVTFSPDGQLLAALSEPKDAPAANEPCHVYLWDVQTWKERTRFSVGVQRYPSCTVSSDGKPLAVTDWGSEIGLWDIATGRKVGAVEGKWDHAACLVFSPDGKMLACADHKDGADEYPLFLVETATGLIRRRFLGHRGHILCSAFSPDGEVLASGSMDTTILFWDLTGRGRNPEARKRVLSAEELEKCWLDLSKLHGPESFVAIQFLAAAPSQAMPFLASRLRPFSSADPRKVAQWITDLESDLFEVRRSAAAELEALGESAEPALRRALEGAPSPELRRQVEHLLARGTGWSPKRLRILRAIEVLERIGSSEARRILEELAHGAPEVRLTQEAKAAVERLDKRHGK
jgi:WD40 repeat protein